MEKKLGILNDDVVHIKIQNEDTKEVIAIITQNDYDVIKPYVIRVKEKPNKKD